MLHCTYGTWFLFHCMCTMGNTLELTPLHSVCSKSSWPDCSPVLNYIWKIKMLAVAVRIHFKEMGHTVTTVIITKRITEYFFSLLICIGINVLHGHVIWPKSSSYMYFLVLIENLLCTLILYGTETAWTWSSAYM